MRTIAIFALALAATPASAFLPERDEYEPVRIERCDVLTSPSISDDGSCLSIGGAASFGYARSSRDGTFGAAAATLDFMAVNEAGQLLTQAHISLQFMDRFPPGPIDGSPNAWGNVSIGADTWTVRAGGLRETALNFTDGRPFGLTLDDYWWGGTKIISETGIQATAEIFPDMEATFEHGLSAGNMYSGGSISFTRGPLTSHFTLATSGRPNEWIMHAATSIIEDNWSALAAVHADDGDDWSALISGTLDVGAITLAGFYGHEYDWSISTDVFGVEGSYRLTDDLQVAASFSRRSGAWGSEERIELTAFQTLTDTIEVFAATGHEVWDSPGLWERQFVEAGIKYEPTDDISLSLEGYTDTSGVWRFITLGSVEF